MAVGMACAGSGLKEAVALLEPMLLDAVDFVRQVRALKQCSLALLILIYFAVSLSPDSFTYNNAL